MLTLIKMKDKDDTDNEQPTDVNQEHTSQNDNEDVEAQDEDVEVDGNKEKIDSVESPIPNKQKEDDDDDNGNKESVDSDGESNKLEASENMVTDDNAQEQPIEAIQEHKSPLDAQSNNNPMEIDETKMEQPTEAIQESQSPKKIVEDTLSIAAEVASVEAMNDELKDDSDHEDSGPLEYTSDTPVNESDGDNEDDTSDFNPAEIPEKDEEASTTTTHTQKSSIQRSNLFSLSESNQGCK